MGLLFLPYSATFPKDPDPPTKYCHSWLGLLYQLAIKKMFHRHAQSDKGNSSIEVASSKVTLVCVKMTKS